MAAMLDKSSEEVPGMYLVHLYHGETLLWPFKVTGQRAIPLPIAYHDDTSDYEDGWWEYCSKCFHLLLLVPEWSCYFTKPVDRNIWSSSSLSYLRSNENMGSAACCLRWVTPPILCL